MKKIATILVLSLLCFLSFGQTNKKSNQNKIDDFSQQVEMINVLLSQYDTLSPFSDDKNRFGLIDSLNNEIISRLLKVLNDERILNYQIESLFAEDELMISKSADNRVYFLSIDEKTGGSYRTSKTIIHYRLLNGAVKADLFGGEESEALATSTYGEIYLLDDLSQKYFVIGGVQVCNTCNVSLAFTLQIDTDSINTDLVAIYDGRHHDLEVFNYNSELMEFDLEYFSADNDDALYGGDNQLIGLKHRYKSKFKYEGGEFVEIEKSEFWDKEK